MRQRHPRPGDRWLLGRDGRAHHQQAEGSVACPSTGGQILDVMIRPRHAGSCDADVQASLQAGLYAQPSHRLGMQIPSGCIHPITRPGGSDLSPRMAGSCSNTCRCLRHRRTAAARRKRTKVTKEGCAPHGRSRRVRHGHPLRGNLVQHRRYSLRFGDHRVMASADLLTVPACLPGSCSETPV
jgi:hypothetical protein